VISDLQYLDRLKLAVALRRNGDYEYARRIAMDLCKERPAESSVWHTLGQIWTEIGEFEMALECHQESVRLMRTMGAISLDSAQGREQFQMGALGLGQSLMRFGRFSEGLPFFEAGRQNVSWTPWPGSKPFAMQKAESLLVQSEGGYGDTFMFMRWLPKLKQWFGVKRLGLMVWKPLETFCDWHALGVDDLYVIDRDNVAFDWQYSTSIMSMPSVFGMKTWQDVPVAIGPGFHLSPIKSWDNNLPFRLGFCWRAEENTSPVRTKSLPVEKANDVIAILQDRFDRGPGFEDRQLQVFSLSPQKADLYNAGVFEEPEGAAIEPFQMTDWEATASYIYSMDFVLTVDTAVAHLAGLLGVPTLVLLPTSSCWRWGTKEQLAYHWYGNHLTYFRQQEPLKWNAHRIVEILLERIEEDERIRTGTDED
jgi:hypothetical protein